MKKKIFSLILALCFCLSVFAGCSLIEPNQKAAAESVVANISYSDGTSEDITRLELNLAYRSYGYNYVQNYNMSLQDALQTTLDTVIENKLLARIVEEHFKAKGEKPLDIHEKTYLWDQTYTSIKSNLKSYMNLPEDGNSQDDEENKAIFKDYEKKVELRKNADGTYTIIKLDANTTIRGHYGEEHGQYRDFEAEDGEDKKLLVARLNELLVNTEWKTAFNKYIKDVKDNYSYLYDYETNDQWFEFEIGRIYDILKDNYMIEKFDTTFNNVGADGSTISNVTVQDILQKYSANVREDYGTYSKANSSFNSQVVSDFANMDYFRNDVDVFNLAYIKFAFSTGDEGQTAKLEEIKNSTEYDEFTRPIAIDNLYNSIDATNHIDNTKTEKAVSVLKNLKDQIATPTLDQDKKVELFRDYMYKYSDDDTLKGAEVNAAFGFTRDGEYLAGSNFTGEDFEKAIRKLWNGGDVEIGALSDVVRTDDGMYVFFFAGKVPASVGVDQNYNLSRAENIEVLYEKQLNVFSSKTLFDKLYESLPDNADDFSTFRTQKLNEIKSKPNKDHPERLTCVVTQYPNNYQ